MIPPTLNPLPAALHWLNPPLESEVRAGSELRVVAGPETDWFHDPAGGAPKRNAPVALFTPPDPTFSLSARVIVNFTATYDAGVVFFYESQERWAKLCFEYSPQAKPGVVSVVTRDTSDDCNSVLIENNTVYLRLYRQANVFAFHYSTDGRWWHLVRYFTLGPLAGLRAGFSAQSPTGAGCSVTFDEIHYEARLIADIRDGS